MSVTLSTPCRLLFLGGVALLLTAVPERCPAGSEPPAAQAIRAALDAAPGAQYRLFAVRVGVAKAARRGLFIADRSLPKRIEVAFAFWVLRSADRTIVVDTGFTNQAMIDRWQITRYRPPREGLRAIGVRPEEVTDVVITHNHWDHIGGLSLYAEARIWISKTALRALDPGRDGRLPRPLRRAQKTGRLRVTRGVEAIAPAVVVVPVGLHAPGFQFVVLRTNGTAWVLASDVAPLRANFARHRPTGQTDDPARTLEVQETMRDLVDGDLDRIVPGHEPGIFDAGDIAELTKSKYSAP